MVVNCSLWLMFNKGFYLEFWLLWLGHMRQTRHTSHIRCLRRGSNPFILASFSWGCCSSLQGDENNICEQTSCVKRWGVFSHRVHVLAGSAQTGWCLFSADHANDPCLALNLITWWGAAVLFVFFQILLEKKMSADKWPNSSLKEPDAWNGFTEN